MPDESTMASGAAGWTHSHTTSGSGDYKVIFKTENKFVDQDINVTITTPAAGAITLAAADSTANLTMGTASGGKYSPTATVTGNANVASAGWVTAGDHSVSDTGVVVGKVNQSTLQNGATTIASGTEITPSASDQTITITEGYNTQRTLIVKAASASTAAEVTSGTAIINSITAYTYNTTGDNAGKFTLTGSADISAPTVDTAGYISNAIGTKNAKANGAQLSALVNKISINAALSGTTVTLKPTLSKQSVPSGVTDAASGSATPTAPSSGVYVAIRSGANTGTIKATPGVQVAGYGTTTEGQYTVYNEPTATVGAAQSDIYYVPITTTSATVNKNKVTYGSGWITAGESTVASGTVTSGTATINSVSYSYDSSNDYFTVSGSATVSAPTVGTEGYISSTIGTRNSKTNGAVVSTTVDKIIITSAMTTPSNAPTLRTPSISKQEISIANVTDAASGAATTTAPSSGVYVAVQSAKSATTITSTPSVNTAGYGTINDYGTTANATKEVGAAASAVTYIPITTTTATVSGNTVTYGTGWITGGTSTVAAGTVTSGSKAAEMSNPTYNSTSEKFEITASGTIPAPTVNTAGYISTTIGTRNTGSISGVKELDEIVVGATVTGTAKVTPAIARTTKPSGDTWEDASISGDAGKAITTKPTSSSSYAYVAVDAAAKSNNLTIKGKVVAEGYGTISEYTEDTAITQAVGSNAASRTYVPIKNGTVVSGTADISSVTYTYNNSGYFDVAGSANIPAPTVTTAGYVSSNYGTKTGATGGATVTTTVNKIGIQANLSGTGTKQPTISKHSDTNVVSGDRTTTKPSSGYYVAVNSAANTGTVKATATVVSAGYGTTTAGQYNTTDSSNLTVGASASATTYIPIMATTFANAGTSGTTYSDISSSVDALISGDYLYINAGYTPDVKISLAKLVPDGATDNLASNMMLAGYSAYNDNGVLVTGNIQTYTGIYEEV